MKTILSYSGGLDSTCLLAYLLDQKLEVIPVNFHYGSKHNLCERISANTIAKFYGLKLIEVNLDFSNFNSSLLVTGEAIPEGHYQAENMKSTVVPFRNGIMLSYLAGLAESMKCSQIAIAAHSGDHHIYPDCRPDFLDNMRGAIHSGTYAHVELSAPFTNISKADIVRLGNKLQAPLQSSWTCYKGGLIHCGKCGACVERKEAFELAEVNDLTEYES